MLTKTLERILDRIDPPEPVKQPSIKVPPNRTGLPETDLVFLMGREVIKWDCRTGEVKTIV